MGVHVRYVGNVITVYCAVMMAAFFVCPIIAIPFILKSEISVPSIILSAFCFLLIIIICVYSHSVNIAKQLYTWCIFKKDFVIMYTLFQKKRKIIYNKCSDVGVGYYIHGILNSNTGSKVLFIYISYDKVDLKHKSQMNLLKPTQTCSKIGFRKKTYQYLLNNLPPKQSKMLEKSYVDFQSK